MSNSIYQVPAIRGKEHELEKTRRQLVAHYASKPEISRDDIKDLASSDAYRKKNDVWNKEAKVLQTYFLSLIPNNCGVEFSQSMSWFVNRYRRGGEWEADILATIEANKGR